MTRARIDAAIAPVISQSWIDAFEPPFPTAVISLVGDEEGEGALLVTEGDGEGLCVGDFDGAGFGVEVALGVVFGAGGVVLVWDPDFTAPELALTMSDDSSTASNARAGTLLS